MVENDESPDYTLDIALRVCCKVQSAQHTINSWGSLLACVRCNRFT